MKTLVKLVIFSLCWLVPLAGISAGESMDPELRSEAKRASDRGLRFLRGSQLENGSWGNSVGMTALVLRAFLESHRCYTKDDGPFINRPVAFILSKVKEDGSISDGIQNRNYNTATAMFALQATGNPRYKNTISNAQKFLSGLQLDEGEGYQRDHKFYGGIGYGGDERPDLSNQYYAMEALRATSLEPDDPAWEKALLFISRSQNRSESNDQAWAANDGGFTYMPGYSPHGGTGSYGSMTHAGLIGLIFAGVDKNDPGYRQPTSGSAPTTPWTTTPGQRKSRVCSTTTRLSRRACTPSASPLSWIPTGSSTIGATSWPASF